MLHMRSTALTVLLAFSGLTTAGCYNHYQVPQEEFRKLQSPDTLRKDPVLAQKMSPEEVERLANRGQNDMVSVQTQSGQPVAVGRETKLFARSVGGRRYQVTPFNFNMAGSMVVASDRMTLVRMADLASFEVDHFSGAKTGAAIGGAAAVAAGFIVVLFVVAGTKSTK
jgi:hypothetical protein